MTSKERLLTALAMKKPDRCPVTIHQWQRYHLDTYMGGISDIQAFRKIGLDASVTVYPFIERTSQDWKVEQKSYQVDSYIKHDYTINTPKGILTYSMGENAMTTWVIEHIIKKEEDIKLLKYRPLKYYDKKQFQKAYDNLGDDGIIRTFLCGTQGGCWQEACDLFGTAELILATFDNPDWVHEFLGILLEEKLQFVEENIRGAKVDLVETGGGASSNTVISPSIHEKFCLPYDKKIHDIIRSAGYRSVYHTCGGMIKILDYIMQNGCDVSETLSTFGIGGDIKSPLDERLIKEKFKGRVAMIGGLDQVNILSKGRPEQVKQEVRRLFSAFGEKGGYILSASDHFFDAPVENLVALAEAGRECKY